MIIYSTAAILLGFLLDLLFGDPHQFPHIVVGMGSLIGSLEKFVRAKFPKTPEGEQVGGVFLVSLVLLICVAVPFCILFFAYRSSLWLGFVIETLLCYQLLAMKSLHDESMKVYHSLQEGTLEKARRDVSMIVGRDTEHLDEIGVTKAAVETVAENTSDGVVAPLFYIMLGGAIFGCIYKAVNTLDSMVGYKNERYLHFGRAAAKLDDALNFLPARLAARLMIIATFLVRLDTKHAKFIYKRDKHNHASPNSAHTEAVCAGALNIQLAGDAVYFGKLTEKPFIGDDIRTIEPKDICRANRLMFVTSFLMLILVLAVRIILIGVVIFGAL
jgi:adenosylcobinamide-phosphate synthase